MTATHDDDLFDGPGSSALVEWEKLEGRLLLVKPLEIEKGINTEYGENDAIRADIVVLDGPDAPEKIDDALVFPRVVQGQIRRNVGTGRFNLGRLGRGEKRPGKSAPWTLLDPTDADKDVARRYISGEAQPPF